MDSDLEWANQTAVHPVGLAALVVLAIATVLVPKRFALVPLILMACFVSSRQRVVIAGLDFTFLRLLVLAGWGRLVARGELRPIQFGPIDSALAGTVVFTALASIIRSPSVDTLVFTLGTGFDAFGLYLFSRIATRNWEDLRVLVWSFALIAVPVAGFFLLERATGRNPFSLFGGVPVVTMIREGKLRCQGPFSHPILAGCFWASLIPLFAAEWWRGATGRRIAVVGTLAALTIVFLSASSTPIAGVGSAILGGLLFRFRRSMQTIRRALLAVLLLLHIVMDAPVWHLISRIDLVGGSTGWHRYHLIDQTVAHFGEWALVGTQSTAHWGHLTADLANQYVLVAVRGGVLSLACFVALVAFAFQAVGRAWRRQRPDQARVIRCWALGVSLFSHVMMFLAVSYFGQTVLIWYVLLGVIRSSTELPRPGRRLSARGVPVEAPSAAKPSLATSLRGRTSNRPFDAAS